MQSFLQVELLVQVLVNATWLLRITRNVLQVLLHVNTTAIGQLLVVAVQNVALVVALRAEGAAGVSRFSANTPRLHRVMFE